MTIIIIIAVSSISNTMTITDFCDPVAMGTKSETLSCQALGVGRALAGVACTMAVIFGTR